MAKYKNAASGIESKDVKELFLCSKHSEQYSKGRKVGEVAGWLAASVILCWVGSNLKDILND